MISCPRCILNLDLFTSNYTIIWMCFGAVKNLNNIVMTWHVFLPPHTQDWKHCWNQSITAQLFDLKALCPAKLWRQCACCCVKYLRLSPLLCWLAELYWPVSATKRSRNGCHCWQVTIHWHQWPASHYQREQRRDACYQQYGNVMPTTRSTTETNDSGQTASQPNYSSSH